MRRLFGVIAACALAVTCMGADKPDVGDFTAGARLSVSELNNKFGILETAIEGALGRGGVGESPNSMEGNLDMDGNKIINLGTPTADGDAASKGYVDLVTGVDFPLSHIDPEQITDVGTNTHAQIDTYITDHDHDGGDGAQINHTTLSNIGSNTHTQIDSHISNTSNPHSVTGDQSLPTQSGHAGQYLGTNGSTVSWSTPAGAGDVVGPASAVDSNLAAFDTTTGKLIKDSGKAYPAGTIVGTTDSQTLTNKALSTGTTAVTQTYTDDSTSPATTAFVKNVIDSWHMDGSGGTTGAPYRQGSVGTAARTGTGLYTYTYTSGTYPIVACMADNDQYNSSSNDEMVIINTVSITATVLTYQTVVVEEDDSNNLNGPEDWPHQCIAIYR